ncbi:MAG: threonine synthase [Firmicutes bacterium]|nr:threonine synthase [Bacillota bacterium]
MEQLMYQSTRGDDQVVSASEAILRGIASDGGLYVPTVIPRLTTPLTALAHLDYQALALQIMSLYLTDYTEDELRNAIMQAYDHTFTTPAIAPLVPQGDVHFLELFHGPTLAFKDMALSILPHLLIVAAEKQGLTQEVVILTATSGDTGKAALEGFANVPGTKIIVFFPEHGVSPVQKRQMVTQAGENTHVIGIEGNFDDAQNGVKAMFTDESLRTSLKQAGYIFSSANSINIGRLVPQIVYYYYAYLQLVNQGVISAGQDVNFAVPTGNFGNILAAYYARCMGLPIGKLICASNTNKVLFDFLTTGIYDRKREFVVTMSPSMDILISSNLERLLYHASGQNAHWVRAQMQELTASGHYQIPQTVKTKLAPFVGGYASEEETALAINQLYQERGYLMDPHTAVAFVVLQKYRQASGDTTPTVVISTASASKFAKDVLSAIDPKYKDYDDFALLAKLGQLSSQPIPMAVQELEQRTILHKKVCQKDEMRLMVENILGL